MKKIILLISVFYFSANLFCNGSWMRVVANAPFGDRRDHTCLVYDNKIWLIGGQGYYYGNPQVFKDVWNSADGINWNLVDSSEPFGARWGHTSVVYNNFMWVIGGGNNTGEINDVWYSSNGSNWVCAATNTQFPQRIAAVSYVYNSKMWVATGYDYPSYHYFNDIWYSTNGSNWFAATTNGGFQGRWFSSGIVYNNIMYLIGGDYSPGQQLNDIWSTVNGTNWIQVINDAPFTQRDGLRLITYNNKLMLIGGFSDALQWNNEVWTTTDCINWTQEHYNNSIFSPRGRFGLVNFGNKLYLIGGATGTYTQDCEVWTYDTLTGIKLYNNKIPLCFSLSQNYPNPFNPSTNIKFDIPKTANVKLVIYDILGREITTLVNEELKAGSYKVDWDASQYSSGVYFYKLGVTDPETSSGLYFSETKRMILLK